MPVQATLRVGVVSGVALFISLLVRRLLPDLDQARRKGTSPLSNDVVADRRPDL